ncbi:MAG: 2Fe-2S iron-sulfur cluster-binding protein [Anaerolineales bacterium]|jgi:uncharacterized 2Fe-2S/4Fe-4S cluster protein (DUF4445 family)
MKPFIDFEPVGRRGECQEGENLLECARFLGVDLVNICGGEGTCGSCVVQELEGKVSPITEAEREFIPDEELAQGYAWLAGPSRPRVAECRCQPNR